METTGVKFLGNQLSFCRPHCDLRWTNIRTPFESWDRSNLIYSKKDERFYLLAPGGKYLCSWDLNFKKDNKPKFLELVLHNIPNLPSSLWKRLDSLCREDHWVESPSGESFLVKWYKFAHVYCWNKLLNMLKLLICNVSGTPNTHLKGNGV